MKITAQYNYNNQYKASNHFNHTQKRENPSFGISFKPKVLADYFAGGRQSVKEGISRIQNVRSGEFGTECKGSIPLTDFEENFSNSELKRLYDLGYSTNIDGYADCYLKSSANKPLSTSSVYDCSVLYLFNKDKNTHFLYHAYYNTDKKEFEFILKTFMPEGFTKAEIIPGDAKWYLRHIGTMTDMLKAVKSTDKTATVSIHHVNSKLPEIVGYGGNVFEIPNIRTSYGFSDQGQASFKICDLRFNSTVWPIINRLGADQEVEMMRKLLNQPDYDIEVIKIFNRLLDQRQAEINKIKSCNSIEELNALIKSYPKGKSIGLFRALIQQKAKILSGNF